MYTLGSTTIAGWKISTRIDWADVFPIEKWGYSIPALAMLVFTRGYLQFEMFFFFEMLGFHRWPGGSQSFQSSEGSSYPGLLRCRRGSAFGRRDFRWWNNLGPMKIYRVQLKPCLKPCLKLEGLKKYVCIFNYNSIFRCMLCIKKWMYMEVKTLKADEAP